MRFQDDSISQLSHESQEDIPLVSNTISAQDAHDHNLNLWQESETQPAPKRDSSHEPKQRREAKQVSGRPSKCANTRGSAHPAQETQGRLSGDARSRQ